MWIILDLDDFRNVQIITNEDNETKLFDDEEGALEYAKTYCVLYQLVELEDEQE